MSLYIVRNQQRQLNVKAYSLAIAWWTVNDTSLSNSSLFFPITFIINIDASLRVKVDGERHFVSKTAH
jgi:hypothetical protein